MKKSRKRKKPGIIARYRKTRNIVSIALFLTAFAWLYSQTSGVANSKAGGAMLWTAGRALPDDIGWIWYVVAIVLCGWTWNRHKIIGAALVGGLLGVIVGVIL